MTLLSVRNLSLDIRGQPVLRDISFDIAPGSITAITGESGSGKSMTALSIMRLLPDGAETRGSVMLEGKDLMALTEREMCDVRGRGIGMVFQEPMTALDPVQTIGDQVAETLIVHGAADRAGARRRAREVLGRVGLDPERISPARYPHELSGGQRQRVVIACAIALRPRLLIADEPTTALDVTTQARILALLKSLVTEEGMALLMITHDLAVVADMADRIAVMNAGRIVEAAETGTLLARMAHPYTRSLFAASTHRVRLPPPHLGQRPVLELSNVVRAYRRPRAHPFARRETSRALDGVSFAIHEGERLGLVGESGSGKSTLARAILGLEDVDEGAIRAFGEPVSTHMPAALRARLQLVFQDPYGSFNPRHRVARLVAEPLHLRADAPRGAARSALVARALRDVGLSEADAGRFIHEFSGGQRQRIAIARALINDPELVVFDEAVSALDVRVRAQILDLIADISRRRALAYLFISHDLSVVRNVTDRVIVLRAGRIVEEGPTGRVFDSPRHPYTQALVEAAPRLPEMPIEEKADADPA